MDTDKYLRDRLSWNAFNLGRAESIIEDLLHYPDNETLRSMAQEFLEEVRGESTGMADSGDDSRSGDSDLAC